MTPVPGRVIWIACEVKPGAFANERLVRAVSDFGEWVGFVPVESLRDDINEGETYVRGTIIDIEADRFRAQVAGDALTTSAFAGSLSRIQPVGTVEAGYSSAPR